MATKTFKVALSLDNPRIIQSGINVRSFDKQSIKISIELTKNSQVYQIPTGAQIKISLLKLARQEQKIILDVPFTSADSIDWVVPDYLDGYQGEVRVGVYLIVGTENIDVGYFNITSSVSDIDNAAEEFTESVLQGWAIEDLTALLPQFQAVLDETTGKDVISAPEIILARGGATTLGERLDSEKAEVSAQLAQKATKQDIENMGSARPKGVYATLSALQTALPTGDTEIYLVTADGNWYYWNGTAWTSGGTYQSTGLGIKTVDPVRTSFLVVGKNLFDRTKIIIGKLISTTTGAVTDNAGYVVMEDYVPIKSNTIYMRSGANSYIVFYDLNKNFISGISNAQTSFTTPANAVYAKIGTGTTNYTKVQVEEGSAATSYEEFRYVISGFKVSKDEILPDAITSEEVKDGELSIYKTNFASVGKNLFNKDTRIIGHFVNNTNGNITAHASYDASDFIPVKENTEYTATTGHYMAFYDAGKTYISGMSNATSVYSPRTFTTPDKAKYIIVSIANNSAYNADVFQVEEGAIQTSYEPYGYKLTKELPSKKDLPVELMLPAKIYALVGQELNIYFDNIMNDKDSKYDFDVTCDIGAQFENYYRVRPATAGVYPITIKVYQDNIERATTTSEIIVSAETVGEGVSKKILVIGDSTTANGIAVTKLNENFNTDVMNIETLGTKGTAPNNHEGVSGWRAETYVSVAESTNGEGITTQNAFWNPATSSFDFGYYLSNSSIETPEYVVISLGINDIFSIASDASLQDKIPTMLSQYQTMIDSIKLHDISIKIGVAITIPPNYSQDAFGKGYRTGQTRWRYKRNNFLWTKALISYFKDMETDNVYLVPINTNLDTRYNMGLETLPVNARNTDTTIPSPVGNGGVHPVTSGYWQIADVYWYWLKSFEV